ncbi:MAG: LON peptidase substrate-binding domain-containing protein [Rubrivivax sp.]
MNQTQKLPLFPLGLVLFPDASLSLRVFEARYLDLMGDCMRNSAPFGVVCLREGHERREVGRSEAPLHVENVGVFAHIAEVDAQQPGILLVQCQGGARFRLQEPATQRPNGLWEAVVSPIAPDPLRPPGPAMLQTVSTLAEAIQKLQQQDRAPFSEPHRLDEAGWVANRWCELLPVSIAAKQKLMELDDPVIRLSLVDGFLRDKKVVI